MAPLTPLVLILLTTTWLLAAPSFAGTKLDLSPYLAVLGEPGDFKVFDRSTGGQRRVTVLELGPWTKGWRELTESEVTGAGANFDGTVISEDFLIPGKQLLSGNEFYGNGLTFFARKPVKGLKLLGTPGKPQRINQKMLLLVGNSIVGTMQRRLSWTIEGFELVQTPSGTYADALRAKAFVGVRLRGGGDELIQLEELTFWYAPGLGVVRADIYLEFYNNGSLEAQEAWSEELSSGTIDGVPFP